MVRRSPLLCGVPEGPCGDCPTLPSVLDSPAGAGLCDHRVVRGYRPHTPCPESPPSQQAGLLGGTCPTVPLTNIWASGISCQTPVRLPRDAEKSYRSDRVVQVPEDETDHRNSQADWRPVLPPDRAFSPPRCGLRNRPARFFAALRDLGPGHHLWRGPTTHFRYVHQNGCPLGRGVSSTSG